MVKIKVVRKNNQNYYVLVHSYREGKKILQKQIYLGKEIPDDIEKKKKILMQEFYLERYLKDINSIKKNFKSKLKSMPKSAREKELDNFSIKFTYNTQRIEGSTLSLKDTARLLSEGVSPTFKPIRDIKETEIHSRVFFEMLKDERMNYSKVLSWHKNLFEQTKEDIAGKIRNHKVGIAGSKFQPPMAIELEFLLKEFFDWYVKNKNKIHPVELAALVHFKFVSIHPFSDGNGRISRLMMNFILKDNNFPLMDISYEKRTSYYNALERSNMKNDENIFIQWFFRRYAKEYEGYL